MLKKVIAGGIDGFETGGTVTEKKGRAWLKKYGFTDLLTPDSDGCTPMHEACCSGHLDVAQWLFEKGAAEDIRKKNNEGLTPFHYACSKGHLEVAKWLFKNGAKLDVQRQTRPGLTPMSWACKNGHLDVAQWLFENGTAEDIQKIDYVGYTPMHWACEEGYLNVAQWLVLNGVFNTPEGTDSGAADAATNDAGHVDPALVEALVNRMTTNKKKELLKNLFAWAEDILEETNTSPFRTVVLPGMLNFEKSEYLWQLNKDEETATALKRLIADYVGVVRGRELQNVREFAEVLKPQLPTNEGENGSDENAADAASASGNLLRGLLFSLPLVIALLLSGYKWPLEDLFQHKEGEL